MTKPPQNELRRGGTAATRRDSAKTEAALGTPGGDQPGWAGGTEPAESHADAGRDK